jgi:hypothetical protein
MINQPHSMIESLAGVSSPKQNTATQDAVNVKENDISTRPRSDALVQADQELNRLQTGGVTPDTDTAPAGSTDDAQQNAEQTQNSALTQNSDDKTSVDKNSVEEVEEERSQNGELDVKENSPAVSDASTEKDKKKAKKEKDKAKSKNGKKLVQQKSFKDPVKRVMKFVGMGGHHSNGRREVSAFETCKSDDIAPKMHEVNLIEPLVAERVDQERLSDLVFREDCIVVASYDGLVSLWARPGVVCGQNKTEECAEQVNSTPDQLETHPPGLNSPRPGGGPNSPLKQTTV